MTLGSTDLIPAERPPAWRELDMVSDAIRMVLEMEAQLVGPHTGPHELRDTIRETVVAAPPVDGQVVEAVDELVPGSIWVRHASVAPDAEAVVLWFHGGAYVGGEPRLSGAIATALSARTGARVLLPEYRLAPEYPHPAAVEDAVRSYRWLLERVSGPDQVVVGGDSAGGGLVLAMLLALREAGDPLPAAGVTFSPWTDLAITGESVETRATYSPFGRSLMDRCADAYLAGTDPSAPLASPLYGDWRGAPPLLVHVGDHELLLDDGVRLAARAGAAGVDVTLRVWPEMPHVHQSLVGYAPESDEAIDDAARFISSVLFGARQAT
jgi:monoterpene epsilon-lactone hydrolase